VDEAPTPEETVATYELSAALRTVVQLREFQGFTSEETARRLGLTVAAVKAGFSCKTLASAAT